MDNFMDKLAQRFNAQEIIKANSHAEAQELGKLREQMQTYDECMKEMRKLNLKNVETAEQLRTLAQQVNDLAKQAIAAVQEKESSEGEQAEQIAAIGEEVKSALEEIRAALAQSSESAAENQKKLAEANAGLEEFMHKESVRVYRNVQAVLTEELKNQTKELDEKIAQSKGGNKGLYVIVILTLLASLGNLGVLLLQLFGLL